MRFDTITHECDFAVVGGGVAGTFAAIAAARHGARVALVTDRPVLGGNASSEIRMWIRGARGRGNKETGLNEEFALRNIHYNPTLNFHLQDSVLYGMARESGVELILNCAVDRADLRDERIVSVSGFQASTETYRDIHAKIYADCSGDSVIAPLIGHPYRYGREDTAEFNESIAPDTADFRTMGHSCLIQMRDTGRPVKFTAPPWAKKLTRDDLKRRLGGDFRGDNFWWLELGGDCNRFDGVITDTESLRDELVAAALGTVDLIKNSGEFDADTWEVDWLGFIPGKRESRRYVGAYTLTQNDITARGCFDDIVAYGGWSMDDHNPMGMLTHEAPTVYHPAPSPYGIPYRSLYSTRCPNLMFAGRNISVTHAALSSTRVMGTCGTLGQAVGTAAALALANGVDPAAVDISALQSTLMLDDCRLPFTGFKLPEVMDGVEFSNPDAAKLNLNRTVGEPFALEIPRGESLTMTLPEPRHIKTVRLILDSDINRDTWENQSAQSKDFPARCNVPAGGFNLETPRTLAKTAAITADGVQHSVENNFLRVVDFEINADVRTVEIHGEIRLLGAFLI